MATPTPEDQIVDDLIDDVEAFLQRCSVLTDYAESQVQERVRLTRMVDQLLADRAEHLRTIESLDSRLRAIEGSPFVRAALVPSKLWRKVRRPRS